MFRIIVTQVCLTVLAASIDAQAVHIHLDQSSLHFTTMHDQRSVRHMHWVAQYRPEAVPGHASTVKGGDSDVDAVFLNWFHQQAPAKPQVFVPAVAYSVLIPTDHKPIRVAAPALQSHDPPWFEYSGCRAPPSIPL